MALSRSTINKRWREKHPEQHKANYDDWVKLNKGRRNAYMRVWWAKSNAENPEKYSRLRRTYRLKRKYGITLDCYEVLLAKQGGCCALCDTTPDKERYGFLSVDHCHETGKVRGLLCNAHNLAIGVLGDTSEKIARVLSYVKGGT